MPDAMKEVKKRTVSAYAGNNAAMLILESGMDGIYDFAFEDEDVFKDEYPDDNPTRYRVTITIEKA